MLRKICLPAHDILNVERGKNDTGYFTLRLANTLNFQAEYCHNIKL